MDGSEFAVQEGKRIFRFMVSITDEHTIEAHCREIPDKIIIRRVEVPNMDYVLPSAVVHNWFEELQRIISEIPAAGGIDIEPGRKGRAVTS